MRLVEDATEVSAWTASDSRVFYFTGTGQSVLELRAAPTTGGASLRLAEKSEYIPSGMGTDASGVYWFSGPSSITEPGGVDKYSFATEAVTRLAEVREYADHIQTAAGRVLWTDADGAWSSAPDGSDRVSLATAPLFRGLTSDGTYAYWAASVPFDEYSDIFRVPLGGGEPQPIACHVSDIDRLFVDQNALYYRSWIGDIIGRIPLPNAP